MSETAKTLQRWECHHEYIEKVEGNEWGDWVSYDDAAKLLAENERLRAEAVGFITAVGLATTAVPTMEINVSDPVGMMQRVVAENERLRAALGWMLALHDDPQPSYDKGSTIAAARRVHGGGR
jgi:hypothetical protein